jgi:hypothetical protein
VRVLAGDKEEVTCLAANSERTILAAGYRDGKILLWSLATGTSDITFRYEE